MDNPWRGKNRRMPFSGFFTIVMTSYIALANVEVDNSNQIYRSSIDAKNKLGNTPVLEIAFAEQGFVEMLKLFAEEGVDLNTVNNQGDNLILLSALAGRSKADLEQAVKHGINWNITNNAERTVLHYAALGGNLEALSYFKSLGANIEARDNKGYTPVLAAAGTEKNFLGTVAWFIKQGANFKTVDNEGNNLVVIAAGQPRSAEDFKQIIKLGLPWNIVNKNGQTVLHYASAGGNLEALKYFKSLGANVDAKDIYEKPPLLRIFDSNQNFVEIFNWFAKAGANLNAKDNEGDNLIMYLLRKERPLDELKLAVKRGVSWSSRNKKGQMPVHFAAAYGNLDALKFFKSLGADIDAKSDGFVTPLMMSGAGTATKQRFLEMLAWFKEQGADFKAININGENLLMVAIIGKKSVEELNQIIKFGVPWDIINADGRTVLHLAVKSGNVEAVKFFKSLESQPTKTRVEL